MIEYFVLVPAIAIILDPKSITSLSDHLSSIENMPHHKFSTSWNNLDISCIGNIIGSALFDTGNILRVSIAVENPRKWTLHKLRNDI